MGKNLRIKQEDDIVAEDIENTDLVVSMGKW